MKQLSKEAKFKYQLLITAKRLNNISKACLIFGVSREHYYNIKGLYEQYGLEGLETKARRNPNMPNKTPDYTEELILSYSLEHPTYGKARVSSDLRMQGIMISEGGVASVWRRHNMNNSKNRLLALEEKMMKEGVELNEDQLNALIQGQDELKSRHVVSPYPGYLLCQDTFEVGYIKGVGKIYMQTVIDSHSSFGFAKLYTSKTQYESSDMLIDRVLPYYLSLRIPVRNILTDNGSEYCGKKEEHEYEMLLDTLGIKHRRTKVRTPWTNGFVERFNRTILEEFLSVAFRRKWYYSVEQLQKDLDEWLRHYNFSRSHQGYRLNGNTPASVLLDMAKRPKLLTCDLTKNYSGGVR